jgi:hypothetical protein
MKPEVPMTPAHDSAFLLVKRKPPTHLPGFRGIGKTGLSQKLKSFGIVPDE